MIVWATLYSVVEAPEKYSEYDNRSLQWYVLAFHAHVVIL